MLLACAGCGLGPGRSPSNPLADPSTAAPSPSLTADTALEADRAAVFETWNDYVAAMSRSDGAAAIEHIASTADHYFEKWRTWALYATKRELLGKGEGDRLATISLRITVDPAVLRDGTARDVMAASIDGGFLTEMVAGVELGRVSVSDDGAFARLLKDGASTFQNAAFHHEEGKWKVDLSYTIGRLTEQIFAAARAADRKPGQFVRDLLVEAVGRRAARLAWRPIDDPPPSV